MKGSTLFNVEVPVYVKNFMLNTHMLICINVLDQPNLNLNLGQAG